MASPGSSKCGYDYEFVSDPPKHLECSICLLTLRDAHVISCCGNHYCQPCIGRVQNDKKPCPLCNEPNFTTLLHKGIVREVNSLKIRCPQRELGCDWEGELGQVELHLNPREGSREQGCGYVLVECTNKCGKKVARAMLQDHEIDECPNRPMDLQTNILNSLAKKFDAMMAEIEVIKSENRELKAEKEAHVAEIEALKENVKQLQESYAQLNSCLTPVPPFYFTLENFEHYKENNLFWWSPPFYSHLRGYKMCILVYPNGCIDGKGTHLSLYIAIRRGEFDDHLQWPFQGEVTVQMYNKVNTSWDHETTFSFHGASMEYKKKPASDLRGNKSWGHYQVLLHKQLQYYCPSRKAIHFRVINVKN